MKTDLLRIKVYFFLFVVLLLAGTMGFAAVENLSIMDAFYFSIVTMATVGYGDITPHTVVGKILALVLIVGGVGTFLSVVASITDMFANRREEELRREKLNMVTGLFFSEMGNGLVRHLVILDPDARQLQAVLKIDGKWKNADFPKALSKLEQCPLAVDLMRGELPVLKEYLQSKAELLLRLIENPVVHEHEYFSDLLRAVFHLRDELLHRNELTTIPDSDRKHLEGDLVRVYRLLTFAWLRYMQYLKNNYGYLFSLAVRTNPFDPGANATVIDPDS